MPPTLTLPRKGGGDSFFESPLPSWEGDRGRGTSMR
jgi:hypothetical protein